MLKSFVTAVALASAATVALVLILFGSVGGPAEIAQAGPGDVTEVAIDTNVDDNGDQHEDGTQGTAGDDQCYDNVDNDGDTRTDGADYDCQTGAFLDNNDTTVSAPDYCVELAVGQTAVVDLWVDDVDPADLTKGYQFDIDYDSSKIGIGIDDDGDTRFDEDCYDDITGAYNSYWADWTDNDGDTAYDEELCDFIALDPYGANPNNVTIHSRNPSGGGAGFLVAGTDVVTNPNSVTFVGADGTANPPGTGKHESGDGVLARFTVTGVATGTSPLTIPSTLGGADDSPDSSVYGATGTYNGQAIPIVTLTSGLVAVGEPCVAPTPPPAPDVRISGLQCVDDPATSATEVVAIKNFGGAAQDMADWELRSDPVDTEKFALSGVQIPGRVPGRLGAGEEVFIWSGNGANYANNDGNAFTFPWDTQQKYRDGDDTDFAQIVDGDGNEIDKLNCTLGAQTPTPTPSPTPTPTPTATPTPTPFATIFEQVTGIILRGLEGLTTDGEGDGATAGDPVETTVTPPGGGAIGLFNVTVLETAITESSPTGFTFFGQEVNITVAPPATAANPLRIAFLLDGSITGDETEDTVQIFKNGVKVADCSNTSGTASPDPCVFQRRKVAGDIEITVLTSTGSLWNFGRVKETGPGTGTPTPTPTGAGTGTATPTPTPTATTAGASASPQAGPAVQPISVPQTGDGIPLDEGGGGSVLPWLFVGLGVVIAMAAAGYVAYSARGRFAPGRVTTRRRLFH